MKNEKINYLREELFAIPDLNADSIAIMTESQMHGYIKTLETAVESFNSQKESLEAAMAEQDYAQVLGCLKVLAGSLSKVCADSLAKDCERQVAQYQDVDNIRHERLKAYVDYFLSTVTVLFDDLAHALEALDDEKAEQKQEEAPPEAQNENLIPDLLKSKLHTIMELNSEKIDAMTEEELYRYVDSIHAFQDEYPKQEKGLKNSIRIKHYVFVQQWLTAIEESLTKINADDLAYDCRNQINENKDFNSIRHEKLEAYLNYFLSTLSILSADIKALQLPKITAKPTVKAESDRETENEISFETEVILAGATEDCKKIFSIYKMIIFSHSLKTSLADTGHELVGATSSGAALAYLKTAKPDLFILDEDLPGLGAYAMTKKIREMGQRAPIVLTTSNITKNKMVKFMEAGVADFIVKPITAADVQKKVSKHLG
ncbi:MAG: response regulator [Oscillospiraceae bacterium]|nr:response regulator [Oscillospiraceae bacterium]